MEMQELSIKKSCTGESTYDKAHYAFFNCKEISRNAILKGDLNRAYYEITNSVNQFHEFLHAPDIDAVEKNQIRVWYMNLIFERNELCLFAENKNNEFV
uniref:Uncharacterized protein n=1 Tax=Strongyloides venezuelensis TaxID=75913 RepID=A0A0K0FJ17_STRVS